MTEFISTLWHTALSFAAVVLGVLFIAYLLAAASMPLWMNPGRKVRK